MIVKTTDFILDAYIPNRDDAPNSDIIGNETALQGFIDLYEEEALMITLGYELYTELKSQFKSDGTWEDNVDQKWKDLVDGKEAYRGMKEMIVGYVFWKFVESDNSHYATVGNQRERADSADGYEMRPKAILNYKKFYERAIGEYYADPFIADKPSIWGNLRVVMWSGAPGNRGSYISMYAFIQTHISDYNNWKPTHLKSQNYFDI